MKFDDFFIDQVKNSVNIVDVVQDYVRLVKKGQNYQALCPFHTEKTPSFSVSPSKQIFKCFGCGAAGDVVAFVSRIENLGFPETVRLLAEKNGLSIPESTTDSNQKAGNRKRLLELMSYAASYYSKTLSDHPDGLDFLRGYGISDRIRQQFNLGFDDGSGSLEKHLSNNSFTGEEIRLSGLGGNPLKQGDGSIVLPLTDISGKILNFAYLPIEEGSREVIPSPDTALFQGGRGFFGLHKARQVMKEKDYVILTGNALEAMLLVQKGIPNTVTCVGKSLSEQQARILGRNTKKVIINHIPGSVRGEALLSSVESLLTEGFSINVAVLPVSSSLSSLLEEEGLSGYAVRLKSSVPIFDYILDMFLAEASSPLNAEDKKDLFKQIQYLLRKIPSRIARAEYKRKIAERLRISVGELDEIGEKGRPGTVMETTPVQAFESDSITRTIERDSFLDFSPEFREKIRAEYELTETILKYQKLTKRNLLHTGKCPFHTDNASSLRVNREKQLFKCSGCGAGGDIFSYISKFEEITLPESILSLARETGIQLPDLPGEEAEASDFRYRLLTLMTAAAEFFKNALEKNQSALQYLDNRGINDRTREKFNFGYAPAGNILIQKMREAGYSLEELEAAGLAARNDSGEYYDKFRNRIILSIKNLQGRIIAFGGRAMGDFIPKYLNSPETLLYNKRKQLFGLSDAREHIIKEDFAILVEGYFDCVVPSQFGIGNVVASLGTSLTEQQVNLLGGFTRNIIICFDPDSAGREAAARSINMFLAQDFKVKVMQLPEGMDPDTVLNEQGLEAFKDLLAKAAPFLDFMIQKHQSASASAMSPQGKQKIVSQIIPSLLMVPNKVERSQMAARTAALLKLDEKLILEELRRYPRQEKNSAHPVSSNPVLKLTTMAERILLAALLDRDRDHRQLDKVAESLFDESGIRLIFETVMKLRNKGIAPTVTRVWDDLDETQRDLLEYWAVSDESVSVDKEDVQSSVAVLHEKEIKRVSKEIQEEIARNETNSADPEKLRDLLRKKERLRKQTHP